MNDNYCVSSSYEDSEMPKFFIQKNVKARKQYMCCECGDTIFIGIKYESSLGIWDNDWRRYKTCLACVEIRNILFCNGYLFEGLSDDIFENANEVCIADAVLELSDKAKEKFFSFLPKK